MSICSASVSMSSVSDGSGGSGGDIVVIRGQGTDQGEVKMEADGKLQFANRAEGGLFSYVYTLQIVKWFSFPVSSIITPHTDHFIRKRDYLNQTVVCTFETGGRYIGAKVNDSDSTVSGIVSLKTPLQRECTISKQRVVPIHCKNPSRKPNQKLSL